MPCKYLEGAIPPPGSSLDDGPCVTRSGRSAIIRNDDGEEECASCARTAEQMGGDWLENEVPLDPFTIDIVSDFPEQVGLRFTTNGSQGGDAGHGGKATLEIIVESSTHTIGLDRPQTDIGENRTVTFTARGDLEIDGLARALIKLGDQLREAAVNRVHDRAASKQKRTTLMTNEHPSEWTEDEFIAAVLREHPELKIDFLPDGTRIIRGISLKPEAEKLLVLGRRLLKEKP